MGIIIERNTRDVWLQLLLFSYIFEMSFDFDFLSLCVFSILSTRLSLHLCIHYLKRNRSEDMHAQEKEKKKKEDSMENVHESQNNLLLFVSFCLARFSCHRWFTRKVQEVEAHKHSLQTRDQYQSQPETKSSSSSSSCSITQSWLHVISFLLLLLYIFHTSNVFKHKFSK